jgi:hypothetical protein
MREHNFVTHFYQMRLYGYQYKFAFDFFLLKDERVGIKPSLKT